MVHHAKCGRNAKDFTGVVPSFSLNSLVSLNSLECAD